MKIKEFIKKVKTKITELIGRLTKTAKVIIPIGIEVVNLMKDIVESKEVDVLTKLTPTTSLGQYSCNFSGRVGFTDIYITANTTYYYRAKMSITPAISGVTVFRGSTLSVTTNP